MFKVALWVVKSLLLLLGNIRRRLLLLVVLVRGRLQLVLIFGDLVVQSWQRFLLLEVYLSVVQSGQGLFGLRLTEFGHVGGGQHDTGWRVGVPLQVGGLLVQFDWDIIIILLLGSLENRRRGFPVCSRDWTLLDSVENGFRRDWSPVSCHLCCRIVFSVHSSADFGHLSVADLSHLDVVFFIFLLEAVRAII